MSIATQIDIANTRTLVCDVVDVVWDQARLLDPVFTNYGAKRQIHGPVRTIKCFEDNSKILDLIATDGQNAILVIDGGGSLRHSLFGGNMALKAKENSWAGLVLNACVRDIVELKDVDIGIFAIGKCPRHPIRKGLGEVDVRVFMAGAYVNPGDYLYADEDGVVVTDKKVHMD